jgi:hypothetical protein
LVNYLLLYNCNTATGPLLRSCLDIQNISLQVLGPGNEIQTRWP